MNSEACSLPLGNVARFPYPGSGDSVSSLSSRPLIVHFNIKVSDMKLASCFGAPRLRMATIA